MIIPIPFGWRQTRIFTKNFEASWYLDFLCSIVIPFHRAFPNTPFFITRYESVRGDEREDKSDTEIEKLPTEWIHPESKLHRSFRLRYAQITDEDAFLDVLIDQNKFWFSDFRGFDLVDGLGSDRFSASTDLARRKTRAEMFAQILWHHSRLILDTVVNPEGAADFEENKNSANLEYESVLVTEFHLLRNASTCKASEGFPLLLPKLKVAGQAHVL